MHFYSVFNIKEFWAKTFQQIIGYNSVQKKLLERVFLIDNLPSALIWYRNLCENKCKSLVFYCL